MSPGQQQHRDRSGSAIGLATAAGFDEYLPGEQ
jgi:hypothetical protein